MTLALNALIDRRSEPHSRAVLEDMQREHGERPLRLGLALRIADADADAADAAFIKTLHRELREEPDMRNGLKIISYLPGRYGYGLTRIGWMRRVSGDEYELLGGRTLWRESGNFQMGGLNRLAADGPSKEYRATEPDKMPEELHRLLVRRVLPANEEAWVKLCPKPKGWVDTE